MEDNKLESNSRETTDIIIQDYFGSPVTLRPRVELYSVYDFMGREMPGLALDLYQVDGESGDLEPYATLTKCFGEFISMAGEIAGGTLRADGASAAAGIPGQPRRSPAPPQASVPARAKGQARLSRAAYGTAKGR